MGRQRLNQRQIAEALGITQGAVWKRLDGKTPFRLAELETLAGFLRVPVARLLGETPAPGTPSPTLSLPPPDSDPATALPPGGGHS